MFYVIKNKGMQVRAYRLGTDDVILKKYFKEGKLKKVDPKTYEVFSREACQGDSGHGELARAGDYIKIDGAGYPYPNKKDFFVANHRKISGHTFEQLPQPIKAWDIGEPLCEEICFLLKKKGLVLHENDPEHFYSAMLWGTREAAARDAVILFYAIDYDTEGKIRDVDFNFISKKEFLETYRIL